jgi:hypothetical protein
MMRRMLKEAGVILLTDAPSASTPSQTSDKNTRTSRSLWPLNRAWSVIGAVSGVVGLLVLYPWFSVSPDFSLRDNDPFSESFKVVYDGFIPISKVEAFCVTSFDPGNGVRFEDNMTNGMQPTENHDPQIPDLRFTAWLFHGGQLSVTCESPLTYFSGQDADKFKNGSKLDVNVVYKILGIPRGKTSSFRLVSDSSGKYHWQYVP